jgi:hypothetical protein
LRPLSVIPVIPATLFVIPAQARIQKEIKKNTISCSVITKSITTKPIQSSLRHCDCELAKQEVILPYSVIASRLRRGNPEFLIIAPNFLLFHILFRHCQKQSSKAICPLSSN